MKSAQNNPATLILSNESTWPTQALDFLNKHHDLFHLRESIFIGIQKGYVPAKEYDEAHEELHNILLPFHIKGYHCTKLTESEILNISKDGMKLQNLNSLSKRIDNLVKCGAINLEIANKLKTLNQADDENRSKKLWFCFFPPKKAGQWGIERFFRSWGGEALYNSHEHDPETGEFLRKIGKPCIIEANIPISSLNRYSFLTDKIVRNFLKNRGLNTQECCDLEGYSQRNILALNIKKVFQFPNPDFIELSDCNNWDDPL